MSSSLKKGYLILETGEVYSGQWQGGEDRAGEIVFNTSSSGYEEIATDPSYFSQIVVLTNSMQGNYGIDLNCWESEKIQIEGFICQQIQDTNRDHAWKKRLIQHHIPLVSELDTRKIVLRLRNGTPWGALVSAKNEIEAKAKANVLIQQKKLIPMDWVHEVSTKSKYIIKGENQVGPKIAVLDFGTKKNILNELLKNRASEICVFPSRSDYQEILSYNPKGVLLSNGPGNPEDVLKAPDTVRNLIGKVPLFGICMGHQILSIALGAKTYKLKFGHRGGNHPIKDDLLNKIYMTSQNHGYAVVAESLPEEVKVTQWNLNDNTVAGIYSKKKNCLGIQYHPESHPGPHEAQGLFDFFINKMM